MVDIYEQALLIRARIAALRHHLQQNPIHIKTSRAPVTFKVTSTDYERLDKSLPIVPPKTVIEPDWDAIAALKAKNDEREAKNAEMEAMKAKLRGNT
jgi:hypothetical protein